MKESDSITTERVAINLNRIRKFFLQVVALTLVAPLTGFAQADTAQSPSPRAFEAASIHPHQGPLRVMMGFSSSGPRLTLEGYNLRALIMEAYNLKNYQVSMAAYDSQQNDFFDIAAKAEGDDAPTKNEFRQMLQTLLADRFNLKLHHETQQRQVYALVVGKSGPKFKESPPDTTSKGLHGVNGRNQTITMPRETMESLADDIWNSFMVGRPVVDRTGLTGTYIIQLEATPEFRINSNPQPEDISIFTAVQEQLGLKLELATAPLDILVVDSAQPPSPN